MIDGAADYPHDQFTGRMVSPYTQLSFNRARRACLGPG